MNLIQYALLCFCLLLIGGVCAKFILGQNRKKILQDMLSLSGAYLFGLLILEMFPIIFSGHNHYAGLCVLAGFFIQIFMEFLTGGLEHGHIHPPAHNNQALTVALFVGLGLHALLDGLPFAGVGAISDHQHHNFYSGILLHKVVEGFTMYLLLDMMGHKAVRIWQILILFSLITPAGMVMVNKIPVLLEHIPLVLAFAGGSLLHVAITILFETENLHHHGIPIRKLIWIGLGLGMAVLIALV
jgi:zinc transporter ZupT